MLERKDVFVLAPTGSGKSLCFHLIPAVLRALGTTSALVVVFSPLMWLIDDQMSRLVKMGEKPARPATWYPDANFLFLRHEELTSRVIQKLQAVFLSSKWLAFVVDEAHCALNWGDSFRPDYRELKGKLSIFQGVPKMALTATASKRTIGDITTYLGQAAPKIYILKFEAPTRGCLSLKTFLWSCRWAGKRH